jgi:pyruvate,water dikinase
MAKEMLPGQIRPLVWSVNIPLVNGTWIRLLSEITGKIDVHPEDLAKSFYFRTYFNIAALSKIFREFGLSTDSLEMLMISSDDSKPSFKPGLRTIRHLFRIIRFIRHKLGFEKIFLSEYDRLTNVYKDLEKRIKTEFSLENYQELNNSLYREGGSLTYLNIVAPIMMHIYHRRLKSKLKKREIDYRQLDFISDFPELKDLSPLTHINKIRTMIYLLPDHIKSECNSYEKLKKYPEGLPVVEEIEKFLGKFGHFSESGTDFSVPKWNENPEFVFNMILKSEPLDTRSDNMDFSSLNQKYNGLSSGLHRSYLKAGRFKVYREMISSFFIYGHGLFRSLFLSLGNEFINRGVIDSTGDIFYLGATEINNILDEIKSGKVKSYKNIIASRKNEIEATGDYILPSVIYGDHAPILETGKNKNHFGVCASSGIFTGKTRVVKGLNDFGDVKKGDVILIPFSDVSWTPVLSMAGAIVSETGGLLSHCSIIAREMGIPALASVENICSIGNGVNVSVDGSNGILTIHDYE